MKANDKRQNYLLDFYPSEGVHFHCQLTAGTFGERQKKYTSTQVYFSQCPQPNAQCPQPNTQCQPPNAQCPTPS